MSDENIAALGGGMVLLRRAPSGAVWTTGDQRQIAVRSMSNKHVLDCIAMLERKGYTSYRKWRSDEPRFPVSAQGDMARMYAETGFAADMDRWLGCKPSKALDILRDEARFRLVTALFIEQDYAAPSTPPVQAAASLPAEGDAHG